MTAISEIEIRLAAGKGLEKSFRKGFSITKVFTLAILATWVFHQVSDPQIRNSNNLHFPKAQEVLVVIANERFFFVFSVIMYIAKGGAYFPSQRLLASTASYETFRGEITGQRLIQSLPRVQRSKFPLPLEQRPQLHSQCPFQFWGHCSTFSRGQCSSKPQLKELKIAMSQLKKRPPVFRRCNSGNKQADPNKTRFFQSFYDPSEKCSGLPLRSKKSLAVKWQERSPPPCSEASGGSTARFFSGLANLPKFRRWVNHFIVTYVIHMCASEVGILENARYSMVTSRELEADILKTKFTCEGETKGDFSFSLKPSAEGHLQGSKLLFLWKNQPLLPFKQSGKRKRNKKDFENFSLKRQKKKLKFIPFYQKNSSPLFLNLNKMELQSITAKPNLQIEPLLNRMAYAAATPVLLMVLQAIWVTMLLSAWTPVPTIVEGLPVIGDLSQMTKTNLTDLFQNQARLPPNATIKQAKTQVTPLPIQGAASLTLTGYDCGVPQELKDMSIELNRNCDAFNVTKVIQEKRKAYSLVQRERYQRFVGYACSMKTSREVSYCGRYDHQTRILALSKEDEPEALTREQCETMIDRRAFLDKNGYSHPLSINSTNSLFYYEAGNEYVSSSGEGKCNGESLSLDGDKMLYQAVVGVRAKITLEKVRFASNTDEMIVMGKGLRLDCNYYTDQCRTAMTTYVWETNRGKEYCPYAKVRTFNAVESTYEDSDGSVRTVVKSTLADGSLMLFEKGSSILACDRTLFSTNYKDQLFLHDESLSPPALERDLHPMELRMSVYINNRDAYLQAHVSGEIEREVNQALYQICLDRLRVEKSLQFMQRQMPGLRTFMVKNGEFAVPSGETLYSFSCRPVLVNPINVPECYRELPVTMPRANPDEEPQILFLEPYTRKLKEVGIRTPCSPRFAPKFETVDGAWLQALPTIMIARTPDDADTLWNPINPIEVNQLDFSKGGVYTAEDIENMHRYLTFGQAQQALGYRLAEQVPMAAYRDGIVAPNELFPASSFKAVLGNFLTFLSSWGYAASIFVAVCTAYSLVSKLVSFCYNTLIVRSNYGWGRQLFWSLCPTFFLMRRFSTKRKQKMAIRRRTMDANHFWGTGEEGEARRANVYEGAGAGFGYPLNSDDTSEPATSEDEGKARENRRISFEDEKLAGGYAKLNLKKRFTAALTRRTSNPMSKATDGELYPWRDLKEARELALLGRQLKEFQRKEQVKYGKIPPPSKKDLELMDLKDMRNRIDSLENFKNEEKDKKKTGSTNDIRSSGSGTYPEATDSEASDGGFREKGFKTPKHLRKSCLKKTNDSEQESDGSKKSHRSRKRSDSNKKKRDPNDTLPKVPSSADLEEMRKKGAIPKGSTPPTSGEK